MHKDLKDQQARTADEPVVIADECGDSLWDAILEQEVKVCTIKEISKNVSPLLNSIDVAQVSR